MKDNEKISTLEIRILQHNTYKNETYSYLHKRFTKHNGNDIFEKN